MPLDEIPVDDLSQKTVNVFVGRIAIDTVQGNIVPRPHPGHELNTQQRR